MKLINEYTWLKVVAILFIIVVPSRNYAFLVCPSRSSITCTRSYNDNINAKKNIHLFKRNLKNNNDDNDDDTIQSREQRTDKDSIRIDNEMVDDDIDENNKDLISYDELLRDPILFEKEYSKSRQRKNNLFLLDDIGKAINVLLYAFVISSICLQGLGYGFVVSPANSSSNSGGIRIGNSNVKIDTLENKAFLLEMNGQDEQAAKIRKKLKNYNDY